MDKQTPEKWKDVFKFPFYYAPEGQMIFDSDDNLVLDVRSWGHLTGRNALALPHDLAIKIQDGFGSDVAKMLTEYASLRLEVERHTNKSTVREASLREMMRRTGLYPKVIDWTNKIQELELIVHGLEEGSAEWELKASDNAREVERLKAEVEIEKTLRDTMTNDAEFWITKHNELQAQANPHFPKR